MKVQERIPFGKTDLHVSPLCIGSWQLGGPVTFDGKPDGHPDPGKENVLRMIAELHDLGINHIDTAEQYGAGESERRVGEATSRNRDEWIISTKFGYRVGPNQTRIDDSSPPTILESIEGSLKRLKTDHIDIYLYHCAPDPADLPEAAAILEKAKADGKIRYLGISTGDLSMAKQLHQHGLLDVIQFPTSLIEPAPELSNFAAENNIGVQVRGVMAQGRLSGRYLNQNPTWHQDDNRSTHLCDIDLSIYSSLQDVLPENMSMSQAAVLWALANPAHHTACLGAKNLPDYLETIQGLEQHPLGPKAIQAMETWAASLRE
ncbi:aldo/keto reductase [Akkermansiaceae bacterium]|nr:aldo/keto reductase [Akkermansiaceae bacterium]